MKEKHILIRFVINATAGDDGPTLKCKVDADEHPVRMVNQIIEQMIAAGGKWDEEKNTFYPWHSISRVEWQPYELSVEEAELAAEMASFKSQKILDELNERSRQFNPIDPHLQD